MSRPPLFCPGTRIATAQTDPLFSIPRISLFGQKGSLYDFDNFDLGASRERCAELEEQQKGMKKKINPKVINMIDKYVTPPSPLYLLLLPLVA